MENQDKKFYTFDFIGYNVTIKKFGGLQWIKSNLQYFGFTSSNPAWENAFPQLNRFLKLRLYVREKFLDVGFRVDEKRNTIIYD